MDLRQRFFRFLRRVLVVLVLIAIVVGFVAWYKFFRHVPEEFAKDTPLVRFNYASIGTEQDEGLPYHIWVALPRLFPEYLPKSVDKDPQTGLLKPKSGGFAAFGAAWEDGHEMPIGFTKRTIGFPRVGINCAVCHTSTWRESKHGKRHIVPIGAASRFNSLAYLQFLQNCGNDPRFNADNILSEISYSAKLSALDKILYRYLIIPQTKQALIDQKKLYDSWVDAHKRTKWGVGRVAPFNPVKFSVLEIPDDGTLGTIDIMPLWNIDSRRELKAYREKKIENYHWDGMNTKLTEVVMSSALGDGCTNKSLEYEKLLRDQALIEASEVPKNQLAAWGVDNDLVVKGRDLFRTHCYDCHGMDGERTGMVVPSKEVGTDINRDKMWTDLGTKRYNAYSEGYPWDFDHFQVTDGYLALPLQALWLTGPYLHNGSVPTIADLLKPASDRPKKFYRGYDVIDRENIGFVSSGDDARQDGWLYDTSLRGNGNKGHKYGVDLGDDQKRALLEYLKTL